MNTYKPDPIDTKDVVLTNDLVELTEKLAENTHDIWAVGRIKEGWIYGEKRDDLKKTHPCLVEYRKLPESEKEYDRNTAMQAIKVILKLGYRIIAP